MINTREIILETLMEILEQKKYSHLVIGQVLSKYDYLERIDRAFIKRVCMGTIEQLIKIDYIINQYSKIKTNKMKPFIRTLLRMSVYQIVFMQTIPDSAACNEAVKLAVKRSFSSLRGFVNGVLRTISREKDSISYPSENENPVQYLSVQYSMPEWIVRMWLFDFSLEKTKEILEALLKERPVAVRLDENLNKEEIARLLDEMKAANIAIEQSSALSYAYLLGAIENVHKVPGFLEGKLMVQDIGSMLITEMAHIKKNDRVLDVCAAPGGKTLHAAAKLAGSGSVEARDISLYKINLIQENIERSPYQNISTKIWDACITDENEIEKADVVIADLPCSGLGVIGRKADIKYRVQPDDLKEITALQRKILDTVYAYVKVGGTLLYSTCTINRDENQNNRDYILNHLPFELIEEKLLLPGSGEWDGFYMAAFRRIDKGKFIENE